MYVPGVRVMCTCQVCVHTLYMSDPGFGIWACGMDEIFKQPKSSSINYKGRHTKYAYVYITNIPDYLV